MIEIFEQVKRGEYVKIQTNSGATLVEIKEGEEEEATEAKEGEANGTTASDGATSPSAASANSSALTPASKKKKKKKLAAAADNLGATLTQRINGGGTVIDNSPYVELVNVPIVTPNGDMLLDDPYLSFVIKPGMHLLITGPNGCGQTATRQHAEMHADAHTHRRCDVM